MNHSIWIREADSARDIDRFWAQLRAYFARDVFPDPESEERAYFLDDPEYPASIQRLHERAETRIGMPAAGRSVTRSRGSGT